MNDRARDLNADSGREFMGCDKKQFYKILYFLDYGKDFGGAANALIQQAVLMKRQGHNVDVIFSDYFGRRMNSEYGEICASLEVGCRWETYHISSQPEDIDIICIDENYESIRDAIKACAPDILHSVQINACVELAGRELGIPHVMNIYPLLPEFFSLDYMDIFPHYHLCDSWHYARKWHQYLHTDSKCIRTVVNSRDTVKMKFGSDMIRYICVGSVYKQKNQLAVIKAFHKALVQGMNGRLTICGYLDGSYGKQCVQYIEDNGLKGSVTLKGFCTDMNGEYAQNDILICGSTRESYPNVVSEAMANGLAVLSTPVGGVPEVLIDGVNGYLAKGYQEDDLAEQMFKIRDDVRSGKIWDIIAESEKTFMDVHSPSVVGGELERYYGYVLDDYRKRRMDGCAAPGIDEFRARFKGIMAQFWTKRHDFDQPGDVSIKLWYMCYVMDAIIDAAAQGKEIYIWGAGRYGISVKQMAEAFFPKVRIKGFLDSGKSGTYCGYAVCHPDEVLLRDDAVILVAVLNGQNEIIEKLKMMEKRFNRDYFILAARWW